MARPVSEASIRDRDLYDKWAKEKNPATLFTLVKALQPVMVREVSRQSGTLPGAALMAEAMKWTVQAIKTYDPDRGIALATHVTNYLPKVRRMNYKYQNNARLPEDLQLSFGSFNDAKASFVERNGRDATEEELAKELGWTKARVGNLQNRLYSDLTESGSLTAPVSDHFNEEKLFMRHLEMILTPAESDTLTNPRGLSVQDQAKDMGMTMARYQYFKSKLVAKIRQEKEGWDKYHAGKF